MAYIHKGMGLVTQVGFDGLSRAKQVEKEPIVVTIGHIKVFAAMNFDIHSGAAHLGEHLPGHISGFTAVGDVGEDEERPNKVVFLENRKGVLIVIDVAVVKSQWQMRVCASKLSFFSPH